MLLVHGLGSSHNGWRTIDQALGVEREVIMLDLPGHGDSPAEADSGTFGGLANSLARWIEQEDLTGVDMVGSSMGARLVLEMARRGLAGNVVALDPGGFWEGWERRFVKATLAASGVLVRSLRSALPRLGRIAAGRTLLLSQLAYRPWKLDGELVGRELTSIADTATFGALVDDLAFGATQTGPAAAKTGRVTIGWGRYDRLCFPSQAERAQRAFPGSTLVWFEQSGHFPMWEEPDKTVKLILESTGHARST